MLKVAVFFSSGAAPRQVELLTGSHIVVDLLPVEVEIRYALEYVSTIPAYVGALAQFNVFPIALVTILAPILR